jgi:ATP-dependent DNA ligase
MIEPPIEPMEARSVESIPSGEDWLYEPKWDGFRCIAFRNGETIALQSKSGQPLERYFPEIVEALLGVDCRRFVVDGEIYIQNGGELDFQALLQRIHPAATRIRKLAHETPAEYAVFDLLDRDGEDVFALALERRRVELESFVKRRFSSPSLSLSPATRDRAQAQAWLRGDTARFDGVIAKRLSEPYHFGDRDAVVKIKHQYTADCVVGGFRFAKDGTTVASLLLGLYGDDGLLHHVGFLSSMDRNQREKAGTLLAGVRDGSGFTGASPGGASRWGSRETEWHPVRPEIVVEVGFDRVTGNRFRHGTRLVRWRPDKSPRQCTMEQLRAPS